MEIKITTNQVLILLQILSWIIFIGLCIETGGIIVSTLLTLFRNPQSVEHSWGGTAYLSNLYKYDRGYYYVIKLIMTIVAVLKTIMFYLIVKLFVDKKLDIVQPFSMELRRFILLTAFLSLGIGLFSYSGNEYVTMLAKRGFPGSEFPSFQFAGADVWLFMAVILFVIVQIIKKGIEIQTENDLTI